MIPRILVLPGTLEPASPNRRLAFEIARLLALAGASVTVPDLADYPLPLFDADALASRVPAEADRLAEQVAAADALVLVSPDGNGSLPPLAKNAVDWIAAVTTSKGRSVAPFNRLVVGLASASPGRLGNFAALDAWRPVFGCLDADAMATQLTLVGGTGTFDAGDHIRDSEDAARVEAFAVDFAAKAKTLGRHCF